MSELFQSFKQVVNLRRSYRKFDPTPIPEAIMRECLEIGTLAPNSSNLQCWEFYWVRSPERKAELVKAFLSQPAAKTAAELVVAVARPDYINRNAKAVFELIKAAGEKAGKPVNKGTVDYYTKLIPTIYTMGPLSIFGCIKRVVAFVIGIKKPIPREPMSHAELDAWAMKTVALGCENLMLAFRAAGYDTCPMEGMDSSRVKKVLGLPCRARVTMGIAVGKGLPEGLYGPRVRLDSSMVIKEL